MIPPTSTDGYLIDVDNWTRAFAIKMAKAEDIHILTENHWIVIDFVRGYYLSYQIPPMEKIIVKYISLQKELVGTHQKDRAYAKQTLYDLFPSEIPRDLICKIGGLPKPESCF